jgi:atypical dual specificity phosphatase
VQRFYWVIDRQLAGCSRPGAHGQSILDDLAILRDHGIQSVLTLTETPLVAHELEAAGLDTLHLPIDDFQAPTTQQMLQALAYIDTSLAENMPVAVHCLAGQGRTGTVLAAWLLRSGLSAEDAIAEIRALAPGAIESAPQVAALRHWAYEKPWFV